MKPEAFLDKLKVHWKVVSAVYAEHSDQVVNENALKELYLTYGAGEAAEFSKALRDLLQVGILEQRARGQQGYEINPLILPIVQYLRQEQQLGLVGELKALVDSINQQHQKLAAAVTSGDAEACERYIQQLDRILKKLYRQLSDDQQAIHRLAEAAKIQNKDRPLKQRYADVLDAWDEFLDPVMQLAKPDHLFDQTLSAVESQLHRWRLEAPHGLFLVRSEAEALDNLRYRLLDFREHLHASIAAMSATLLPLVERVRLNTQITKGATLALRKLEELHSPQKWVTELDLGLFKRQSLNHRGDSDQLMEFLSSFRRLIPDQPQVEIQARAVAEADRKPTLIHYGKLVHKMMTQRPVADVMAFIQREAPQATAQDALAILAAIHHYPSGTDALQLADTEGTYQFNGRKTLRMRVRQLAA